MHDPIVLFGFINASLIEIISFTLAIVMVGLNIRQSPWGWLFAIASAALYSVIFYDARLYGDMSLQFFFIAVSIWGWYQWLFGGAQHRGVQVSRLDAKGWGVCALGWLAAYLFIFYVLHSFTDTDVPHIDAFLTSGSLVGQFLLSRKKLENWHLWIFIDLIYIGLYIHKNLILTALLFAVFVVMATIGLFAWKKSLLQSMSDDAVAALKDSST